ncbi:adenosylcobinamide-GDP ribazoletransferase [Alkalihalobacillus sp. CinArs1]|uniref:adenosylcobinamide-GDP ribazoletransferase n=1 Tax=Alkalihalobacillus sp. CinArs1 TaxID=2995314 RepID=UPI0022DD2CC0|nr:adenosylcobinamide-GDP ribazoletransferase [Alkalihalobacillus sp. CinArs1]
MSWLQGILINLQFFTTIPVHRELSMGNVQVKRAVQTFPLIGLMQGALTSGFLYALVIWTPFSNLAISFMLWLFMIVLSGGIHLDGWMDASDAFFSYQQLEKRLQIMSDPRTGAFGVLSVIVLLGSKFLFIYETIQEINLVTYLLIATIPFLSKSVMGIFLITIQPSKEEGLATFFQKAVQPSSRWIYLLFTGIYVMVVFLIVDEAVFLILTMIGVTVVLAWFMKRKIVRWFGGITGDVLGASVEGTEVLLWMTVWLSYYFVTG